LGSVRLLVNVSNGNITQRIDYDAWGNQVSNLGSSISSLSFAGCLYDEHTGLVRFGARDFNPTIGRWTNKDPIGFGGGVSNLYEYCINDPVNFVDPSGLQWIFSIARYIGGFIGRGGGFISGSMPMKGGFGEQGYDLDFDGTPDDQDERDNRKDPLWQWEQYEKLQKKLENLEQRDKLEKGIEHMKLKAFIELMDNPCD